MAMKDGRCPMCHDACGMHVGLMMDAHVTYMAPIATWLLLATKWTHHEMKWNLHYHILINNQSLLIINPNWIWFWRVQLVFVGPAHGRGQSYKRTCRSGELGRWATFHIKKLDPGQPPLPRNHRASSSIIDRILHRFTHEVDHASQVTSHRS